jgi:hypothetical protein
VQYALGLVVKESFTLYKSVSEGVINLADNFFEMEYLDAGEPGAGGAARLQEGREGVKKRGEGEGGGEPCHYIASNSMGVYVVDPCSLFLQGVQPGSLRCRVEPRSYCVVAVDSQPPLWRMLRAAELRRGSR